MTKAHIAMGVALLGAAIFIGSLVAPAPVVETTNASPPTLPTAPTASISRDAGPTPTSAMTPDAAVPKTVTGRLKAGQTIGATLQAAGLNRQQVARIVDALKGKFDFRLAKTGNPYEVSMSADGERFIEFRLEHSPIDIYVVKADTNGTLSGRKVDVKLDTLVANVGAEIKNSLYGAITDAGESPRIVAKLVEVFAWDLDFYRDTQPGDTIKLVVEKTFKGDTFIGYGRILAAEYRGQSGTYRTFWFESEDEKVGGYYLDDGQNAEKSFLATPLKFTRISSGYNPKRKHPILGYTKAHLAIDYAAPTGTPVWAMADGKVTYVGWLGAAGKVVRIRHRNKLTSSYAHLNRYARGLKKGMRVKQKQIIGYVGTTGRSTGPHLHFAVRRGRRFINPLKLKMTRKKKLPQKYMNAFKSVIAGRLKALDGITILPAVPSEKERPQ
ncbi:MAG: peptidoglycan DD-metalloendopeptidase family protein [Myxococcota bacterium]|nr:peptidoglycan DD-metalloendopeptidase family protein [Myxococcota bacterium]